MFQRKCSSRLRSSLLFFDRLTVSLLLSRSDRAYNCGHHFSYCTIGALDPGSWDGVREETKDLLFAKDRASAMSGLQKRGTTAVDRIISIRRLCCGPGTYGGRRSTSGPVAWLSIVILPRFSLSKQRAGNGMHSILFRILWLQKPGGRRKLWSRGCVIRPAPSRGYIAAIARFAVTRYDEGEACLDHECREGQANVARVAAAIS